MVRVILYRYDIFIPDHTMVRVIPYRYDIVIQSHTILYPKSYHAFHTIP